VDRTITPSLSSLGLDTPRVHLPCNKTITPTLFTMKVFDKVVSYLLSLGIRLVVSEIVGLEFSSKFYDWSSFRETTPIKLTPLSWQGFVGCS